MGKTRKWPGEIECKCAACGDAYYVRQHDIDQGSKTCSSVCYHIYRTRPVAERFWEKVNRDGPTPSHAPELGPCWVWTGATSGPKDHKWKYGLLGSKDGESPRPAHRVSWQIAYGPIPKDLQILHKCDNPPCVRPTHLSLGTGKDNIQDMLKKGRHMVKLSENQVHEIKSLYAQGTISQTVLAARYRVGQNTISRVVRGLYSLQIHPR